MNHLPEPLGPIRELWLGHVSSWDGTLGLGRLSGAADDRFGSFVFALEAWRAEGQPVPGQTVGFVLHPTTRRVVEVAILEERR
jgi:hypothetical protein